jgi:hypothetical protein
MVDRGRSLLMTHRSPLSSPDFCSEVQMCSVFS